MGYWISFSTGRYRRPLARHLVTLAIRYLDRLARREGLRVAKRRRQLSVVMIQIGEQ